MKWKREKEDDSDLLDEKFDVHFSDLLEQQNYVITLKTDMPELTFAERCSRGNRLTILLF